ncbi:hypothetical protein ACS126_05420 [Sphingobacterium lactis]|uniref:hypothetical protein n=1 Tax=Sphingobacterium lactis TaxID=797291 RepID=UPI003EC8F9BB
MLHFQSLQKKSVAETNYIHVSSEGKISIRTEDLLRQTELIHTIEKLLNSPMIREIDDRKKRRAVL